METPTENGFNLSGNDQTYQKMYFPYLKTLTQMALASLSLISIHDKKAR